MLGYFKVVRVQLDHPASNSWYRLVQELKDFSMRHVSVGMAGLLDLSIASSRRMVARRKMRMQHRRCRLGWYYIPNCIQPCDGHTHSSTSPRVTALRPSTRSKYSEGQRFWPQLTNAIKGFL